MAHKFIVEAASPLAGTLRYSDADRGFSFQPQSFDDLARLEGSEGRTSLVADTLQLEVAVDSGRALYVWGYLPKESWQREELKLPTSAGGAVAVELDDPPLEEHISVSIARSDWDVLFDESSRLVRVVRDRRVPEKLVEIADGVHLGLNGTEFVSFWLCPEFVE
ncbi:hypothetical protein [Streptomyces sp. NBC_00525]|uniref:hypothetical protein n=1 Tax=Streptomyces sp. NBC_00525 TaxID=2903660 RepID=UPI002E803621|nr:hypothetical protein [Streptomyces sp. NBC_00525]WUC93368.1 hypothetical protein OG710_06965 [Streptomyces sp. NBC_00525]